MRSRWRALASQLPTGASTVGISMQLILTPSFVPPGTAVHAAARVVAVSPEGDTVSFETHISDGIRELATGKHVRAIARR